MHLSLVGIWSCLVHVHETLNTFITSASVVHFLWKQADVDFIAMQVQFEYNVPIIVVKLLKFQTIFVLSNS